MQTDKGLRYNQGKRQWSLFSFKPFEPMIEVLEYGAHKYSIFEDKDGKFILGKDISVADSKSLKLISSGRDNWKKGFDENELWDSFYRHLIEINAGEEFDKESGLQHLGHLMCNIMFIAYARDRKLDITNLNKE